MADSNTPGYSFVLPPGEGTLTYHSGTLAYPHITANIDGAIPTNDWWSSLVFPYFSEAFSGTMFAAPLAMQTTASGLDMGYRDLPKIIYDASGMQVKYEYSYHKDLSIGLTHLQATDSRLHDYSDWTATAAWQDNDSANQLQATFGHGMPFVYFTRQGSDTVTIKLSQLNDNAIGQPNATAETFVLQHVSMVNTMATCCNLIFH